MIYVLLNNAGTNIQMKFKTIAFAMMLSAVQANADNSTRDAAIGGGIGGATGAAVGNEVSGREGAIIGGALGGAIGAAIGTENHTYDSSSSRSVNHGYTAPANSHPKGYHCPPGQRKKGRC